MKQKILSVLVIVFYSFTSTGQGIERLLKINGTEINVNIIGQGPPIIVVHGGPGLNHNYFLPHLQKLAATHRLILIDQRACGKSSAAVDSSQMSLDWLLRDMESIRNELKLGRVTVIAHSWGGLLGLLYASRYPNSVTALILANTVSPKVGEFSQETNAIVNERYSKADSLLRVQTIKSEALKQGSRDAYMLLFKLSFKQLFYDKKYSDSLNLFLPEDFLKKRQKLFFMTKELSSYDFYPDIKNVSCPTLVIHGDYDGVPIELPRKINQSIPKSRLIVIKNAGHFPFVEKNKEFTQQVVSFLKEVGEQ